MVLDAIDPFGDVRLDTHMAILATAIFNAVGATKKGSKEAFKPSDFLPLFPDEKLQSQDVNAKIRMIFKVPDGRKDSDKD